METVTELKHRDSIVSGPISRTVISLAWPVTISMFMEFALASTDFYWVGKLGTNAQDAVTSSMVVMWSVFAVITIASVGMTALISRSIGANNIDRAVFYFGQGLALAVGLATIVATVGYILTPVFLGLMNTSQDTLERAIPYLRIFFMACLFFFIAETGYATFRASGDTKTPTKIAVSVIILNLGLDPLLIFGWGPVPAMGVSGASMGTAIAIFIGMIWVVIKIYRGGLGFDVIGRLTLRPQLGEMLKIARIGLPLASQQFVFVMIYWFLIGFVHEFGPSAAAAMGIGNRMESFSYLTCYGFSLAASTMVGQNLGANKPDRASRCAWTALGIAVSITFIITVLFLTIPRSIAGIFSSDPEVLPIAVDYLIILGLSQTTMATEIVLEGAFGGAGDTLPPMLVGIPGALLRIPLAYYLAFTLDWGINGVWWTLTITTIIKSSVLAAWFYRGKWKLKQV